MSIEPIKLFERFQDFSFCPLDTALHGKAKTITIVENPDPNGALVMIIRCADIDFDSLHSMISSVYQQASETRIILIGCQVSWSEALLLTTLGVHAIAQNYPCTNQLKRMIEATRHGYIYICNHVEKVSKQPRKASQTGINIVTPTAREMEVLELVMRGMQNREIATQLHLSRETVKTHVKHLLEKFNVGDRTKLAIVALEYMNSSRLSA